MHPAARQVAIPTLALPAALLLLATLAAPALVGCGRTQLDEGDDVADTSDGAAGRDGGTDGGRAGSGGNLGGSGGRTGGGTGGRTGGGTGGRSGGGTGGRAGAGSGGTAGTIFPPSPGVVICGSEVCRSEAQSCCFAPSAGGVTGRCLALAATCAGALSLACDEPADCSGSAVCCAGARVGGGGAPLASQCVPRASCAAPTRFVVCRQNSDCAGATPVCRAAFGLSVCQGR